MQEVQIRLASENDLEFLRPIELAAAELFSPSDLPPKIAQDPTPIETLKTAWRQKRLFVAVKKGVPVGFALAGSVDQEAHLQEMAVLPAEGRRGIGSHLLEAIRNWARSQGYSLLTLTTFEHIPWNAPFYRRWGFRDCSPGSLGPELKQVLERQVQSGLKQRVAMVFDLESTESDDSLGREGSARMF